ncbi:hypothetical protein C9374_003688 [Naegleria lovaniensis]|uniref:Uncharacterized protein n=1 Tax=Naegleria lovaniensis TaxID=51637 RepID=A0AA88KSS3_NAELO|nr:uncharacterized protein C9374_003688 [Naegleria lovaniensis]KAG2393924.1 hypothetical protein C9374_003688 [Naegleria lovaniensis]
MSRYVEPTLAAAIASAVLSGLIYKSVSSSNPFNPIHPEDAVIKTFTVGEATISKGSPVSLCASSLGDNNSVCSVDNLSLTSSIMESPKLNDTFTLLVSYVSDLSDYSTLCLVQHVRNPTTKQDAFIFYGLVMYSPVLYFTTHSFDVLNAIENPANDGSSYLLLGVKLFYKQTNGAKVNAKFLLTYVRSTPNTPPAFVNHLKSVVVNLVVDGMTLVELSVNANNVVGPQLVQNGNSAQNFYANQFTIAMANSGRASEKTLFALYFNSILNDKCQFITMSYDNSTETLSLLTALTDGPTGIGCSVGLTSFTNDASTVLLFEFFSSCDH